MICCRRRRRRGGLAGSSARGLMIAPASSADSEGPSADAGLPKYASDAASMPKMPFPHSITFR